MSQTLAKQKFTAEEVQNQLADRGIPALKVLEEAAREAGFAVDEIGLPKLMEQGKLTTDKILPAFARNLRKLANNNDALAKAISQNFAPALGRARNTLKDLSNEIFQGGLKDGLLFVLNSFSDLGKESRGLAQTLGSVLGGAVIGLTFPFKLLYAIALDVSNLLGFKMSDDVLKLTAAFVGAVTGAVLLGRALKVIALTAPAIKAVSKAVGAMGGMGGMKDGSTDSTKKDKGSRRGRGKTGKVTTFQIGAAYASTYLADAAKVAPRALGGAAALLAPSQLGDSSMQNEHLRKLIDQNNAQRNQRIQLDIKMNQNAKELIDAVVNSELQEQFASVFNTMGSSKD